jgi:hypothetical protein
MGGMIFILDELESLPGCGEALHDFCAAHYLPDAARRGLTLVHRLVSPPLWLDDGSNLIMLLWSLPDTKAFWRKNELGRRDPDVLAIWAGIDRLVRSRRRHTLADPADFAALARD